MPNVLLPVYLDGKLRIDFYPLLLISAFLLSFDSWCLPVGKRLSFLNRPLWKKGVWFVTIGLAELWSSGSFLGGICIIAVEIHCDGDYSCVLREANSMLEREN